MKVIIDRFEGEYAVVEYGKKEFALIPSVLLPCAKEGDVVDISVDKDETESRRSNIESLMKKLNIKNKKAD